MKEIVRLSGHQAHTAYIFKSSMSHHVTRAALERNTGVNVILHKVSRAVRSFCSKMQLAPVQEAALQELCILIDKDDKPVGSASKRYCHRVDSDGNIPLHRAFSIFLFNGKGDLLLQKRSQTKVTFPGYYTNTCCSHPLAEIPEEMIEQNQFGVRRAAQRRLAYELGVPLTQALPSDFCYLTRIHYYDKGDSYWGEHEIDYILFLQKNEVTLDPNPDEVSEIRWVPRAYIHDFLKNIDSPLTPWFDLILKHKLLFWWDNLHALHKVQDYSMIQRF